MERKLFLILFLVSIIFIGMYINYIKNENHRVKYLLYKSMISKDNTNNRLPTEWNTRTKSFDSERALSRQYKFMAEPDKCFDCTNQVAQNLGTEYAIYEQPTKLFSMGSL